VSGTNAHELDLPSLPGRGGTCLQTGHDRDERPSPREDENNPALSLTGIFYAQGVKANVLFFDRKPASDRPWIEVLWVYDLRTNQHFTLKQKTLRREHLQDFIDCYGWPAPSALPEVSRGARGTSGILGPDRADSELELSNPDV
jgi:hypothetical protein